MAAEDIVFYRSEDGDQWVLVGGTVGSTVRHEPNAASAGQNRDIPLENFLPRELNTPQGRALRQLLDADGEGQTSLV
jgi:hypothetical protein